LTDLAFDGHVFEVTPYHVFTKHALLQTDNSQLLRLRNQELLSLRGRVEGDLESFVALHISRHGAFGMVQSSGRTWQLSVPPDRSSHSIFTELNESDVKSRGSIDAGPLVELPPSKHVKAPRSPQGSVHKTSDNFDATGHGSVLTVAVECDQLCHAQFGLSRGEPDELSSAHQASTYLAGIVGGVSALYWRDVGVNLQVHSMRIWSGPSPYEFNVDSFKSSYAHAKGKKQVDIAYLFTGVEQRSHVYAAAACLSDGYNTGMPVRFQNASLPVRPVCTARA
jgi:hypothetical protein